MITDLFIINSLFLFFFFVLLTRSWTYLGILFVVESLWVILYILVIAETNILNDLTFFWFAILILIFSSMELVIGLLTFIIFYNFYNILTVSSKENISFFSKIVKNTKKSISILVKKFFYGFYNISFMFYLLFNF